MAWFAAAAAAGASLGTSIFQAHQNRRNAAEAHDWAVEDAQIQRGWQERMSNTAHRREVEDLKAAGLNPILSAGGGQGASTPSGALPEVDKADSTEYGRFVSSALEARAQSAQIKLMKAQEEAANSAADLNKAQAGKARKETDILGPKSYLYDKLEEGLRKGAKLLESTPTKKETSKKLWNPKPLRLEKKP